jgi:ParB family chromosome partitioning protein
MRRLLDLRARNRNKGLPRGRLGQKGGNRRLTANDLMEIYQREAEKQRLLVKKSDYAQTQLLFIVEAMKDLLADDGFSTLLRAERLEKMPRALQSRMAGHVDE